MFLHTIINELIQPYESKKCGQFIQLRVHRKKFFLHIRDYFMG